MKSTIYTLSLLLLLFSCVPGGSEKSESTSSSSSSTDSKDNEETGSLNLEPIERNVVVRTFNEYNSALSSATGISVGHEDITDEFNKIKNSLPANNQASTFSSFSQVSAVRLSFTYCDAYINESDIWKSFDFGANSDDAILNKLMENLLDFRAGNSKDLKKFSELRQELEGIIANKPTNGKVLVESTDGGLSAVKERLTKMTCTAILSSSYYTVL